MDITIVIPCYNERENVKIIKNDLLPVVMKLAESNAIELVFVDDGSSDGTLHSIQEVFEGLSLDGITIKFAQHLKNRGLGAAIRTGFEAATGKVVVTTDSDGTYLFSNIPNLIKCLDDGFDIVTASPYHRDGKVVGVPGYRLLLSRGSSFIYRILVDSRIHTYTCLFRAYRREVIENIEFQSDGFLGGTELLVKAMLSGYRVAEYPAVLYRRVFGTSKAKIARTIWAHLQFQGRILLHRAHLLSLYKTIQKTDSQGIKPAERIIS